MTASVELVRQLCECNGYDCMRSVLVSVDQAARIVGRNDLVLIVDGCAYGPDGGEVLVEVRDGYRLFRGA